MRMRAPKRWRFLLQSRRCLLNGWSRPSVVCRYTQGEMYGPMHCIFPHKLLEYAAICTAFMTLCHTFSTIAVLHVLMYIYIRVHTRVVVVAYLHDCSLERRTLTCVSSTPSPTSAIIVSLTRTVSRSPEPSRGMQQSITNCCNL